MLSSILQMEETWQFLSAFGGVDCCHIPMKCPRGKNEAGNESYDFKQFILSL